MLKKRWLAALFLLWMLAAGQLVQGRRAEEERVAEAFTQIGEQEQMGVVEYCGLCKEDTLAVSEGEDFLRNLAAMLGATDDVCVTRRQEEGREEICLVRNGEQTGLKLQLFTLGMEGELRQYLFLRLEMEGEIVPVCTYRESVKRLLNPYMANSRSSANLVGSYEGKLSLKERNQIADELLEKMDAKVVSEHRDMQLYTIYGYTPWISESVPQDGQEVNVNLVMYDSQKDGRTYLYAAIPEAGVEY